MKNFSLLFGLMLCLLFSCQKDDDDSSSKKNQAKSTGMIKVTVSYNAGDFSPFYHYLKDSKVKVQLFKDGSSLALATQYSTGSGETLDFGSYDYDSYTVTVTGTVMSINTNTGNISTNRTIDTSKYLYLDSSTETVLFDDI